MGAQGWPARVGGARLTALALALSSGVIHTYTCLCVGIYTSVQHFDGGNYVPHDGKSLGALAPPPLPLACASAVSHGVSVQFSCYHNNLRVLHLCMCSHPLGASTLSDTHTHTHTHIYMHTQALLN